MGMDGVRPVLDRPSLAASSPEGRPSLAAATAAAPALAVSPQTPLISPSAPIAPTAPVPAAAPEAVTAQLTAAVTAAPAERVIEVRLDPPSLGRVWIEFDFSGDQVKAVVAASEADTLSLLKRGGHGLLRDLAGQGLGDVELAFREGAHPDGKREEASEAHAPMLLTLASPSTTPPQAVRLHDGLLDLTL